MTGAGRGIGRSTASCLAREGASVAVVSRTGSDLEGLFAEIGGKERGHYGVPMDLTEEEAPGKLAELLEGNFGFPDGVVHNLGGTLDVTDPFCSVQEWRKVFRLNLEVAIELNYLLIPSMMEKKWGRIIHVSSISAMENHGPVTYCAAKAALTAYARSLGRILAPDGVVVSAVLPGAVYTEGGYWDLASKNQPDHAQKYLNERMAIHRFGTPDEISHLITFLCSEQASFCIGSVIPVDGGQGRSFFGQ